MARKQCDHCPKTFKTESGLEWHGARSHQGTVERSQGDDSSGGIIQADIDDLRTMLATLEEAVNSSTGQVGEQLARLQTVVRVGAGPAADVGNQLAGLGNRLKELEATQASVEQLGERVEELRSGFGDLVREISSHDVLLSSLASLVWSLDVDHKDRKRLADLVSQQSPTQLSQARDIIQSTLIPGYGYARELAQT